MAVQTTAGKQQRGRPFVRGVSGNPAGRPKGSRNRASIMAEAVSDADAVVIVRAVVSKARRGDMIARGAHNRLRLPRRARSLERQLCHKIQHIQGVSPCPNHHEGENDYKNGYRTTPHARLLNSPITRPGRRG
jgi:hypothetical protein